MLIVFHVECDMSGASSRDNSIQIIPCHKIRIRICEINHNSDVIRVKFYILRCELIVDSKLMLTMHQH